MKKIMLLALLALAGTSWAGVTASLAKPERELGWRVGNHHLVLYFIECGTGRRVDGWNDAKTGLCAEGHEMYVDGILRAAKKYEVPTTLTIFRTPGNVEVQPAVLD